MSVNELADMETEMFNKASMLDQQTDIALGKASPRGDFSAEALNGVVTAMNSALEAMGLPGDYEPFDSDDVALPPDMLRRLNAIDAAAKDSPVDVRLPVAEAEDDRDLARLEAALTVLSKSAPFKSFVTQGDETTEEPEEPADVPAPEAPNTPEPVTDDFLAAGFR